MNDHGLRYWLQRQQYILSLCKPRQFLSTVRTDKVPPSNNWSPNRDSSLYISPLIIVMVVTPTSGFTLSNKGPLIVIPYRYIEISKEHGLTLLLAARSAGHEVFDIDIPWECWGYLQQPHGGLGLIIILGEGYSPQSSLQKKYRRHVMANGITSRIGDHYICLQPRHVKKTIYRRVKWKSYALSSKQCRSKKRSVIEWTFI